LTSPEAPYTISSRKEVGTMARTGVFFHPIMAQGVWPIIGNKFERFPEVMEEVLKLPGVELITAEPASEELLCKCHSPDYLQRVKASWYWQGAVRAVGGCVQASEMVARGELRNALVFSVAAGHHASASSGWGGTYLACIAPSVANLREKGLIGRVAILDTDCHHGDGTRSFFLEDPEVLHVCFCHSDWVNPDGTKVDVAVPFSTGDEEYLRRVEQEFCSRAKDFGPALIFHNFGHDTCDGDYGDRGLSPEFFPRLAERIKELAEEVSQGRYVIITHGGARKDVAERIFPEIVRLLAS